MPYAASYRASTRHQELGPDFYDPVRPAAFPNHILRYRNRRWARRVGLDSLSDEEWIGHFGRFEPLDGSLDQPLARGVVQLRFEDGDALRAERGGREQCHQGDCTNA